jgi:predicted P-loop ATPase
VLEGVEGSLKSSAIELLAGTESFSDQTILGIGDREQQERLRGKWLYEIADLSGMKRADVEAIKAFASRTHDRARPAYGRFLVELPRRCVLFATTNDSIYLKSQTGNRRFWPVKTGVIDIDALRRDRDQLWAEAAAVEATGLSLVLPQDLWPDAVAAQEERRVEDPWHDDIADYVRGRADTAVNEILRDALHLDIGKRAQVEQNRVAACLQHLGFERYQKRLEDGRRQYRYRRKSEGA